MASRDGDRAVALSRQLAQAHHELRRQLDEIRTGLGRDGPRADVLPLRCLAFCAALTTHHRGEDDGMFAQLVRERPELAPTIAKLVEDHDMITWILSRIRDLVASPDLTARAITGELDGLAAIMESHFAYEERAISEALDIVEPDPDWPDAVFRFGAA